MALIVMFVIQAIIINNKIRLNFKIYKICENSLKLVMLLVDNKLLLCKC